MKIAFIAHPIRGDVLANLRRIAAIGREINKNEPDVIPFAPHFFDCHCLCDEVGHERERGMRNGRYLLRMVDELRLYGDHISPGMQEEIQICVEAGILVIPMTEGTTRDFFGEK